MYLLNFIEKTLIGLHLNTKRLTLAIVCLICASTLEVNAQAEISFETNTDTKQVLLGSYFETSFTLKNAKSTAFKPPKFKNFEILQGPTLSTSVQITNGKMTQESNFVYLLRPKKKGKLTIGIASIKVYKKTYKTSPITIEVLEGKKNADTVSQKIFIEAIPNKKIAYIGQQIVVDFKIYSLVNYYEQDFTVTPEFKGFYTKELQQFNGRAVREIKDGLQYTSKLVRKIAIFPQKTGLLKIDPLGMRIGIQQNTKQKSRSSFFNSFFNRGNIKSKTIQSKIVELDVRPFPDVVPDDFSGAIGSYAFSAQINRTSLSTNDALNIRLIITGDGDVKRIRPPGLGLSPDIFELYEPKVTADPSLEKNGKIIGRKIVEYFIIPKKAGEYQIKPKFTYFDADSARFISLHAETFKIKVSQGKNKTIAKNNTPPADDLSQQISNIKTRTQLYKPQNPFYWRFSFWIMVFIPLGFLGGAIMLKKKQQQLDAIDPALRKRQNAQKMASKHFSQAQLFLKKQETRPFYEEISKAIWGYVSDKLQIPPADLSKNTIKEQLTHINIEEASIHKILQILNTCEMALFGGLNNQASMDETYTNSVNIIMEIEQQIENVKDNVDEQ